jgi:hypothetical protein
VPAQSGISDHPLVPLDPGQPTAQKAGKRDKCLEHPTGYFEHFFKKEIGVQTRISVFHP